MLLQNQNDAALRSENSLGFICKKLRSTFDPDAASK